MDAKQVWRAALGEFFDAIAEAADWPLAPVGVKPTRRVILARRREASRLSIVHDRHARIGHDTIAGCRTRAEADLLASVAMVVANERLRVPADAIFDVEHERADGVQELEFQLRWPAAAD